MLAKLYYGGAMTTDLLIRRLTGRVHRNWADLAIHEPDWDERARIIASLVPPRAWVLEFGAGRRALKAMLPEATYIASDLVARDEQTFVCDLNRRPLPTPPSAGVAVFSGVLEYVRDVAGVLRWLNDHQVSVIVASYECRREGPLTSVVFDRVMRARRTWVNHFTEAQLLALFADAGFELDQRRAWRGQLIGRFVRVRGLHRDDPDADYPI